MICDLELTLEDICSDVLKNTTINESRIINEMTDDVIEYLNNNADKLPFDNIFGDKLRIIIPMGGDITAREILNDLKRIKDFSGFDLKKGEVIRKIKLDPKYGGGEKEQKINMGKAVSSLKISPETKKKYLDWFARYKDNLEDALKDQSEYSIVLSRAPIDVVRMSDHRNISSCHSKGGSYFQCAVQEAVSGGAVAYVVDKDSLDALESEDELQEEDFFPDPQRYNKGVRGVRPPIARLRVRRIESNSGEELAIPDDRIYGDSSIPGFHKTLSAFLSNSQISEINDYLDNGGFNWESRGGTYFDSSIQSLVQNFMGENPNRIRHNYDDESTENDWSTSGWEAELDDTKHMYNNRLIYCNVDYNIEQDDQPYIMPSGSCSIDISSFGLPEDADLSIDDYYDVERKGANGHYDDEYVWSYIISYLIEKVDNAGIGNLAINSNTIEIRFFNENESILNNPDAFDSYCRDVERFDDKIEDMLEDPNELRNVFEEAGLIDKTDYTNSEYKRYLDYMENDIEYKTISLSGDKSNLFLKWNDGMFRLWPVKGQPREPQNVGFPQWGMKLKRFLIQFSKEHFHPKLNDTSNHPTFKNFFESYVDSMLDIDFNISPFRFYVTEFDQSTPRYAYMNQAIRLRPSGITNNYFEFFDFLNEIYPHINNFFKLTILTSINEDDPEIFPYYKHHNLPQLSKLYGKYL